MKVVVITCHDDDQPDEVTVTGMTPREAAHACHSAWEALAIHSYKMEVVVSTAPEGLG